MASRAPRFAAVAAMRKIVDWYHRVLTWLMVATVAVLIIPVTLQIASRFPIVIGGVEIAIPSYIWTEELARFLFIWMIMLGAMIGIRESIHFDVDLLPRLPPRLDAAVRIVTQLFVLVFALVFLWWGIVFVRFGWDQLSELAELPMPYIFFAWPLAGATWALFLGERFWDNLKILFGR